MIDPLDHAVDQLKQLIHKTGRSEEAGPEQEEPDLTAAVKYCHTSDIYETKKNHNKGGKRKGKRNSADPTFFDIVFPLSKLFDPLAQIEDKNCRSDKTNKR